MEKKTVTEKKSVIATNKPASRPINRSTSSGIAPGTVPTSPATRRLPRNEPPLDIQETPHSIGTIIANIINSLPADQRMTITNALISQSSLPSQEKAEEAKKALASAEEARKKAQTTYLELVAKATSHDQQIGIVNAEKAEHEIAEKILLKGIQEFRTIFNAQEQIIASNIIEDSQRFQHILHALDDVQCKIKRFNQRIMILEAEGKQITEAIGLAREDILKEEQANCPQ